RDPRRRAEQEFKAARAEYEERKQRLEKALVEAESSLLRARADPSMHIYNLGTESYARAESVVEGLNSAIHEINEPLTELERLWEETSIAYGHLTGTDALRPETGGAWNSDQSSPAVRGSFQEFNDRVEALKNSSLTSIGLAAYFVHAEVKNRFAGP